jgi:hypothetical protein
MAIKKKRGPNRWKGAKEVEDILLDPRQKMFWDLYANPKSEWFGNAYQSALQCGYSIYYARSITGRPFFQERKRRLNFLSKAEKVLDKTLDMDTKDQKGREQADLLRVQTDVAKHITKTLGKDEGYSERSEVTGKDGGAIVFMPQELLEKYDLSDEKTS